MAPSSTPVGGRSRSRTEIRRHKRATTIAVHEDGIGLDAGFAVDHHHAGSFGSEMPVAPGEQRPQHRPKVAPGISQDVFVARWSFAVAAAFEQTRFDQGLEPSCQNVGRDPEALLELIEARQSERRIAQDEDAPPLPDPLQAAGDRALHVAKALAPHRFTAPNFHVESYISRSLSLCKLFDSGQLVRPVFVLAEQVGDVAFHPWLGSPNREREPRRQAIRASPLPANSDPSRRRYRVARPRIKGVPIQLPPSDTRLFSVLGRLPLHSNVVGSTQDAAWSQR